MPIEARPTSLMVRLFILPVVAPSSDGVSSVTIFSLLVLSCASACVILVSSSVSSPVSSSLISELALSTAICASFVLLSAKGVWASSWSVALSRRLAASSIASALPVSRLSSMTTKLTSFSLVDRTVRSSGSSWVCAKAGREGAIASRETEQASDRVSFLFKISGIVIPSCHAPQNKFIQIFSYQAAYFYLFLTSGAIVRSAPL